MRTSLPAALLAAMLLSAPSPATALLYDLGNWTVETTSSTSGTGGCGAGYSKDQQCIDACGGDASCEAACQCVEIDGGISEGGAAVDGTSSIDAMAAFVSAMCVGRDGSGGTRCEVRMSSNGTVIGSVKAQTSPFAAPSLALASSIADLMKNGGDKIQVLATPVSTRGGTDSSFEMTADGSSLQLHGSMACADMAVVKRLVITVSQASTGAIATAKWKGDCTSGTWEARAKRSVSKATFQPGAATACASAVYESADKAHAAEQWCKDVTLVVP